MKTVLNAGMTVFVVMLAVQTLKSQAAPTVPSCEHVETIGAGPDGYSRVENEFEKVYAGLFQERPDRKIVLGDGVQLRDVVMYSACASDIAGGAYITDNSLGLFTSRQYGEKAFQILDAEARSGGKYAKKAASFRYYMRKNIEALRDHQRGRTEHRVRENQFS